MSESLVRAGRYQIVSELGRGAMGVVYEARDPVIGRTVAIKTMLTEGLAPSDYEAYRARFQREAQSAGVLTHPNIVTIYDFGEDQGVLYLAMEFLKGKPLDSVLQEHGYTPLDKIILIFEQVCDALDFAHSQGIVHRDIKPPNIMVLDNWQVKVTDFGIAKMAEMATTGLTRAGQILGTPNYMSPEQVKGRSVDGRSDIFSLGVILYELITGEKPFFGQNITTVIYKIMHENPIPPRELDSTIHPGLSYVIGKALAKNPDERYPTCKALVEDLRNYKNLGEVAGQFDAAETRLSFGPTASAQPWTPSAASAPGDMPQAQTGGSQAVDRALRVPKPASPPPGTPTPMPVTSRTPVSAGIAAEPRFTPEVEMPASDFGPHPPIEQRNWTVAWVALGALVVVVLAIAYVLLHQRKPKSVVIANGNIVVSDNGKSSSTATALQPTVTSPPPPTSSQTEAPAPDQTRASKPNAKSAAASQRTTPAAAKPAESPSAASTPATGEVTVTSDVAGAQIIVDGQLNSSWTTPHTFSLQPGPHRIALTKSGYKPVQKDVNVVAGSQQVPISLGGGEPTKPPAAPSSTTGAGDAEIDFVTNPPGLQVFLDGKSVGITPVQIFTTSEQHTCKVLPPPGQSAWEGTCQSSPGSAKTIKINYNR